LSANSTSIESSLDKIALAIATKHVTDNCLLGLGSGSTVSRFAKALGVRNRREALNVKVVPSSMQAWLLAKENGLEFFEDSAHCPASVDVAVDGADQISKNSRAMIKGGGGALLKEKIILSAAKHVFILADQDKFVPDLKRAVPVEVSQFAFSVVDKQIRAIVPGAEPMLRRLDKGYPFFTESGNVILDCLFKDPISEPRSTERLFKMIPGVIEAGVFNCKVDAFYKANQDGTFEFF